MIMLNVRPVEPRCRIRVTGERYRWAQYLPIDSVAEFETADNFSALGIRTGARVLRVVAERLRSETANSMHSSGVWPNHCWLPAVGRAGTRTGIQRPGNGSPGEKALPVYPYLQGHRRTHLELSIGEQRGDFPVTLLGPQRGEQPAALRNRGPGGALLRPTGPLKG